jgi:hypothetical protein
MSLRLGEVFTPCVALDVSATGARVYMPNPALMTQVEVWRVALQLPDGTGRAGRRIWQADSEIGFEFFPFAMNPLGADPSEAAGELASSTPKDSYDRDRVTHLARTDIARAWNVDVSQVCIQIVSIT